MNRQGGAIEKVEVTKAMISAGVSAFEHLSGSVDEYFLVEQIYKAMVSSIDFEAVLFHPYSPKLWAHDR